MKRKLRGLKRNAIQLDFNLYRVEVPISGVADAHLSVIDIQPEAVERTILFIHGYAGVAETWEYQINHFAKDYRVVVPDLRGHGQSDAPYTQYTMRELVDDIQSIVEKLKLPEKFTLVGHSFGGSICVEYANAHPERLDKLVLIATAGEYPLPRVAAWLSRVPTAFYRLFWEYRPRWNAEVHVMKRMMVNNVRRWRGWPLLRNISTPTLVITGERDNYFPRSVFEDVGKMVAGAEIYDVGAAKHKVQLERHEAVNRGIERFIQGSERRSWRDDDAASELLTRRPWLSSYTKDIPWTIPVPRQPLHQFLVGAADWVPKNTAIVFYGARLSYEQLNKQVNQFAHALHGLGVGPGDRVMIVLPNVPQMVIAFYATMKIGAVAVLPNPDADAVQIAHKIEKTQAKVLVILNAFDVGKLAKSAENSQSLKAIIFADIRTVVSESVYKKLTTRWGQEAQVDDFKFTTKFGHMMHDLMVDAAETEPEIEVNIEALAAIVYTTGTTEDPKGVCLTHHNLVANALQTRHWVQGLEYGKETFLCVIPFLHSYGLTTAMNIPIAIAATMVMLPVFDLEQVLEHIKKYSPTIFPAVPSMYTIINQAPHVRSYGLSSIKACISGAAPLPVEVQEAFEKLTHGRLVEGYGLTEAAPITHANPLYGVRKVGSIGIPIPNTDAKIVDLMTGEDVPAGQIGELAVRGPQIMRGYWQDESESESVLRDGWLVTGDVAVMDKDGYFKIISRKRDTIFTGKFSVYPRDVEEVLYENNKVLEAAVVGVGTSSSDQKIKAFVVPRPGTKLDKEELLELCRKRLDEYAIPWEIEFRETLPKSFVGKVLRRMLIEE